MKRKWLFAIVFALAALLPAASMALPINAVSYAYFDVQGNLVGQSINTCFNGNPRTYVGIGSQYYLKTTIACSTGALLIGSICYWMPSDTNPQAGTVCVPAAVDVTTAPSDPVNDKSNLPPGMTIEAACTKVNCYLPPAYDPFRWGPGDVHAGYPPKPWI